MRFGDTPPRRVELPKGVEHGGNAYAYKHYRCRCEECRAANTAYQRRAKQKRAARLAADPTLVRHGERPTYDNWGCRCDACVTANTEASRPAVERWKERQRRGMGRPTGEPTP